MEAGSTEDGGTSSISKGWRSFPPEGTFELGFNLGG